jgi:octaprenyl-diphosphate synthase
MIYIIKNENNNTEKVGKVIQQVYDIGGIAYAEKVMNDYKMRALNLLNEFPKNEYQQSLEQLVTYTTERKK